MTKNAKTNKVDSDCINKNDNKDINQDEIDISYTGTFDYIENFKLNLQN